MPTIVTIEKAITSLEEEKAALRVVVVGRDAEHAETLPLTKELLLPRVHAMLRGCLKKIAQNGKGRYSLLEGNSQITATIQKVEHASLYRRVYKF